MFFQTPKIKIVAKKVNFDSDSKFEQHEINPALLSQFKSDSFLEKVHLVQQRFANFMGTVWQYSN